MKITSYISGVALMITISFASCKKFLGGNTNINPNKASVISLNTSLPAVIDATATNQYYVALSTTLFAQQLAAYTSGPLNDDQHKEVRMTTAFTGLYQNALSNLDAMVKLAAQQNAPYYGGIGKILQVVNLQMATDVWGAVPFSEAFKGTENLYPKYDDQQTLYQMKQSI